MVPVAVFVRLEIAPWLMIVSSYEELEMSPPLEIDPDDETDKSVQADP